MSTDHGIATFPFEGASRVLRGERFTPGSDFFKEAQKEAREQTDRFFERLKSSLSDSRSASGSSIPSQGLLQSLADASDETLVQRLCGRESFWMKRIYGESVPPEGLSGLIRFFLQPIQVPPGVEVHLEASPCAVGILASVGAVLGAWLSGVFAWSAGLKSPGDMTVLLGAALGSGLFSTLVFSVTANEKLRKQLEKVLGGIAGVDATITVLSLFFSFGSFFGGKREVVGGLLKRMCLYVACFLLLHIMKRPFAFQESSYRKVLETLFFERIVSVVTLLALVQVHNETLAEKESGWISAQNRWLDEKRGLEERVRRNRTAQDFVGIMLPRVRNLWTVDVHHLEALSRAIAQDFVSLGFELPMEERMLWGRQMETLLETSEVPEPVEKPVSEPQILIWMPEMRRLYSCIGLVDPGDRVTVLDPPLCQDGNVLRKGNVQALEE